MRFASPEWFLLAPVLAILGWRWRRLGLHRARRIVLATLLLLGLAQPQIRRLGQGLDLWVLVDRSASAAETLEPRRAEMEDLIERGRGPNDRLRFIDFAEIAQLRGDTDEIPESKRQQTRISLAVETTLAQLDRNRASRLLLLTDGFSTEPLGSLRERLRAEETPLDFRLIPGPAAGDYRVAKLEMPSRAQPGEPFLIEIDVAGEPDAELPCEIERDGRKIGEAKVKIEKGAGHLRFVDRLARPGAAKYTARLRPAQDSRPGNDFLERWIEIAGGPRILLVTQYADDPVAPVLRAQGFAVETVMELGQLNVGRLSGCRGVILNNVPAYALPPDFLGALDFYVREQGGGLLMTGGKQSFGAGGYFQSPIDQLLPVSMELRAEHRKLAVAMAIVLDRSGSMSATVATGGGSLQKMDLADEGAARCVTLLGGLDAVAVLAVDTQPHFVVPMTQVAGNTEKITSLVRRIASAGGGICVPTGLKAAREELKKAQAGQRHIVLFADANDATQELGNYRELIESMTKEGITISVIGLGSATDSGGNFLEEVAKLGKGRIFFNADPTQLPALFAQETVTVARSAFLDEITPLAAAPGWMEIAARPLPWPRDVDGYNLSYLRPGASAGLFSSDSYAAPLTAWWQRGAGRVAAVSFPVGGAYSDRIRAWPQYADFAQTLARWLAGDQLPPGIGLRQETDGTELRLDLFYDDSWVPRLAQNPPSIALADGTKHEIRSPGWQRMEPGHFRCTTLLEPGQWMRGAVRVGEFTLPFGPVLAGSNIEWSFDHTRVAELRSLSRETHGVERIDLSRAWETPKRSAWRDLRAWLLLVALLIFLADALATRLGMEEFSIKRPSKRASNTPEVLRQ
ncbi:MAG TPA: VWA domain-containing protein [Chthoniobacterales bacterium]